MNKRRNLDDHSDHIRKRSAHELKLDCRVCKMLLEEPVNVPCCGETVCKSCVMDIEDRACGTCLLCGKEFLEINNWSLPSNKVIYELVEQKILHFKDPVDLSMRFYKAARCNSLARMRVLEGYGARCDYMDASTRYTALHWLNLYKPANMDAMTYYYSTRR